MQGKYKISRESVKGNSIFCYKKFSTFDRHHWLWNHQHFNQLFSAFLIALQDDLIDFILSLAWNCEIWYFFHINLRSVPVQCPTLNEKMNNDRSNCPITMVTICVANRAEINSNICVYELVRFHAGETKLSVFYFDSWEF